MTANVGMIDRVIRIVVGILLIAFALRLGFPETGWNWIGWIGVIPILTAIFGYCPAYAIIGLSTCPLTRKET
jgi:Inner membrane protein YgaP-like, transmembrane domain